jgi:hypothetical protein
VHEFPRSLAGPAQLAELSEQRLGREVGRVLAAEEHVEIGIPPPVDRRAPREDPVGDRAVAPRQDAPRALAGGRDVVLVDEVPADPVGFGQADGG